MKTKVLFGLKNKIICTFDLKTDEHLHLWVYPRDQIIFLYFSCQKYLLCDSNFLPFTS